MPLDSDQKSCIQGGADTPVSQESDANKSVCASIEVRHIEAAQACIVRAEVLRPHWTPERCSWPFDDDPRTLHLGGFVDDELATVASFVPEAHPELRAELGIVPSIMMKLRGMATREQYRGRGVGYTVLEEGMQELRHRGYWVVWCNARVTAQRFYERQRFQTWGDVFDNPPVGPHVVMWCRL